MNKTITMKTPPSSSFLVSLGSLVGLGFVFCLSGCGRSGDKGSGQGSSETAPVVKDLSWCCENGDLEGVKSSLNLYNINGTEGQKKPLHLAARGGHRDVAEFLISKGADINMTYNDPGWTPIQYAASSGQSDMIVFLVQKGAKIDIVGKNGDYPIHTAARKGHISAMKMLMDAGANPDQESGNAWGDKERDSMPYETRRILNASAKYQPIHAAAQNNQPDVVKFLILGGTSPETTDAHGNNVLHYATSRAGWRESRAATIRLLDRDGEFEKAVKQTVSTEGYYVTDEPTPKYIRFMPEKMESSSPNPYQRAVISFGPRGGTSPAEISKWLSPYNEEAKKQGDFITGLYTMMKGYAEIKTYNPSVCTTLKREGDQLRLLISSQTLQEKFFPSNKGSSDTAVPCSFVSWK
jgi:hypothetical protein